MNNDFENRLKTVKQAIEANNNKRIRYTSELEIHNKTLEQIKRECEEQLGVPVEELEARAAEYAEEADRLLREAEQILGIRTGEGS